MSVIRNAKKQDFDYYLTNLDWGDGTEIDRSIKQFDRNEVFDHTYEKPGFYSAKGLAFKFERVMIEATPPMSKNMWRYWKEITPSDGYSYVQSIKKISGSDSYHSNLSEFTLRSGDENNFWIIKNRFGGDNDVKLVTDQTISNFNLPDSWVNSIIAPIEKRTEGRTPGIGIEIPINMDISDIDMIYYSFELNLANPNGEDSGSQYQIHERSNPPMIESTGSSAEDISDDIIDTDWGVRFDSVRYVDGIGGNSTDADRDELENGGWRTFSGYIFVQEPNSIASNGSNISELPYQINYSQIEISPRYPDDTPQDEDITAYIGLRNLTISTPNTKNIIRPNEWQRFYTNFIVNPRDDYESPLYEINNFAMIGGVSKKSSYFNTLASLAAFDKEQNQYRNYSLLSSYNPYDFISIYDTMAKFDAEYYNEVLDPYTTPIHEDYAPYWRDANDGEVQSLFDKKRIYNGMVDKDFHGVLQDTELIDVDISTTKVHKGVIPLWEQIGLNEEHSIPTNESYWKNIIPKDYKLTDRGGFSQEPLEDPTKGSLTPRIPRLVWIIDEENDQNWNNGYYWPQLPKMTKGGVFTEPVDLKQYGAGIITSDNPIDETLFNLTFDTNEVEEIKDITDSYNIEYRVDGLLDLDEDDRVELITEDITDTIEKDLDRQAF